MKKFLAIVLAALMLISVCAVNVFAEDETVYETAMTLIENGVSPYTGTSFTGDVIGWGSNAINNSKPDDVAKLFEAMNTEGARFVLEYTMTGENAYKDGSTTEVDNGWFNFFHYNTEKSVANWMGEAAKFVDVKDGNLMANQWALFDNGNHVVTYNCADYLAFLAAEGVTPEASTFSSLGFQSGFKGDGANKVMHITGLRIEVPYTGPQNIVLFESEEGQQVTTDLAPWNGFGIGEVPQNGSHVGDLTLDEIVGYAELDNTMLVMVYESTSEVPNPELQFNTWEREEELQIKIPGVDNGDGTFTSTWNLSEVYKKYLDLVEGGTYSEPVKNLAVQLGCDNFMLRELYIIPGTEPVPPAPAITIGDVEYDTLQAAVDAAKDGDVINVNEDISDGTGVGVWAATPKNITINFNGHTYNVASLPVGSNGTESQAFHLEKGSNITLMNGTITATADDCRMLIQKYCDLTLTDMNLVGNSNIGYVLSNNNASTTINGSTSIEAAEGAVAFDVYYWPTNGYENVSVTVNTTGTISGDIELSASAVDKTAEEIAAAMSLTINNGTINGDILIDKANLKITDPEAKEVEESLLKASNVKDFYGDNGGAVWDGDVVTISGNVDSGIILGLDRVYNKGEVVTINVEAETEDANLRAYISVDTTDKAKCDIVTYLSGNNGLTTVSKQLTFTATEDGVNTIVLKPTQGGKFVNTKFTKVSVPVGLVEPTEEEILANTYDSVSGVVTITGGLFSDKVAVEHLYEGETYNDGNLVGIGRKPYTGQHSGTQGYIYVNEEYHALLIDGAFIVYPHDVEEGFCLTCRAVIEGEDEDDIEVIDPTEPGDTPTEDEEPGDIDVEEPAPDEEDNNPPTGVAFAVLPMVIAAVIVASKKR